MTGAARRRVSRLGAGGIASAVFLLSGCAADLAHRQFRLRRCLPERPKQRRPDHRARRRRHLLDHRVTGSAFGWHRQHGRSGGHVRQDLGQAVSVGLGFGLSRSAGSIATSTDARDPIRPSFL